MSRVLIDGLTKRFGGKPPTVAVDDLRPRDRRGRVPRAARPERVRQDHDAALHRRAGDARRGRDRRSAGEPVFDAAERVDVPPDKRSIGMVFQSYALWPHMTVRKNIAYPLKARKLKDALGTAAGRGDGGGGGSARCSTGTRAS